MKDRTLIYISGMLAIASLGYSAWVHQQSDEAAMRALRMREAELVQHWQPDFDELFSGMGTDPNWSTNPPTTLEHLFAPLVTVLNSGFGSAQTNSSK